MLRLRKCIHVSLSFVRVVFMFVLLCASILAFYLKELLFARKAVHPMNHDTLAYCTIDDGFYLKLPYSISIPVIMRWWDVLYYIANLKSLQSSFSVSVSTFINVSQGHHYNWTRKDCDKSLLSDMLRACHTSSRRRRGITDVLLDVWYFFQGISKEQRRCKIAAEMYYKIVRAFGGSHFERRDHSYCKSTCADKHGSPFENLY